MIGRIGLIGLIFFMSDELKDELEEADMFAAEMLLREICRDSTDLREIGLRVAVMGWDMKIPPFDEMTLRAIDKMAVDQGCAPGASAMSVLNNLNHRNEIL